MKRFLLLFFFLLLSGCEKTRYPTNFIMESNYEGVVVIEYGIPDAPALKVKDGWVAIHVPHNGLYQTSSPFIEGRSVPDKFYYRTHLSLKELDFIPFSDSNKIWNRHNGMANCLGRNIKHSQYDSFYVSQLKPAVIYDFDVCTFLRKANPESFQK